MNISIDYDNTYTDDPVLWNSFIQQAVRRGHSVYCVTARSPLESKEVYDSIGLVLGGPSKCFFTSNAPKREFMDSKGINIHVWIDDMPDAIGSRSPGGVIL